MPINNHRTFLKKFYSKLAYFFAEKWLGGIYIGTLVKNLYLRKEVERLVSANAVKRVLDAGCGRQALTACVLSQAYPEIEFSGIDLNFEECATHSLPPNVILSKADYLKIDYRGYFDLVYSIDVLEHIDDYKTCLRNTSLALRPGGFFIGHVPNVAQRRFFLKGERYVDPEYVCKHGDAHVREGFSIDELTDSLSRSGFTDIRCRYTFASGLSMLKELFNRLEKSHFRGIGLIFLPLAIVLWCTEILLPVKSGNGIFFTAKNIGT